MSEGLEIKLEVDFLETVLAFNDLQYKHIVAGTRKAMNRTLLTMRKEAINLITERLAIKPKTLRDKHIELQKARGSSVENLEAAILFSSDPIPMMEFVRGSKDILAQKGIPISKRRKLRIEITPGKRFVMQGAFIQRKVTKQVFKGRRGKGFKKQGTRSVGFLILHRGIGERLIELGSKRFQEILLRELSDRMKGFVPG